MLLVTCTGHPRLVAEVLVSMKQPLTPSSLHIGAAVLTNLIQNVFLGWMGIKQLLGSNNRTVLIMYGGIYSSLDETHLYYEVPLYFSVNTGS